MRTILLGCAAALALGLGAARAEACSYMPREVEQRPVYAHLVRQAAYIDLVRVTSVAAAPFQRDTGLVFEGEPVLVGSTKVDVSFQTVEAIKGNGEDFDLSFVDGRSEADWRVAQANTAPYQGRHQELDFWTSFNVYDAPVLPDCSPVYPNFQIGEHYLVLRDADGAFISQWEAWGRNFEPISDLAGDAWLNGVRRLAQNPSLDYGRSQSVAAFVAENAYAASVRREQCGEIQRLTLERVTNNFEFGSPQSFLEEAPEEENDRPPETVWSMVEIGFLGETQLCERPGGRVTDETCQALQPTDCVADGRWLLLPGASYHDEENGDVLIYGALGVSIDTYGFVDFSQLEIEIELTGELRPHMHLVESWFAD